MILRGAFTPGMSMQDELIAVHNANVSGSVFARTRKVSAPATAEQLMSLAPALGARMRRREFDFILVRPTRRRLLFKAFCVSVLAMRPSTTLKSDI